MNTLKRQAIGLCLIFSIFTAGAFSLLGPYADWMDPIFGYPVQPEIGGPMNLGEEYRWNVPVVTYGFDQEFLTAFGQRGVDAIEAAIQIFNDLPPASEVDLENYPRFDLAENPQASAMQLTDLKSLTMTYLAKQLGLAPPEDFVYTLRTLDRSPTATNFTVIQRNFDPDQLVTTGVINGVTYIEDGIHGYTNGGTEVFYPRIIEISSEPNVGTVARGARFSGTYFNLLTRDDVGGLRYLYSSSNLNLERLLPGVTGIGSNSVDYVDVAVRPGVDKVTFVRQQLDGATGRFVPHTNDFVDRFYIGGQLRQQLLRRVVTEPDIVFSARDFGVEIFLYYSKHDRRLYRYYFPRKLCEWSGVSHWINNAGLAGDESDGPGIIAPGGKITFQDAWKYYIAAGQKNSLPLLDTPFEGMNFSAFNWGSFNWSTNISIHGNAQTNLSHLTLETRITETNSFFWAILANYNAIYDIQRSTNVTDWQTVQTFTNSYGMYVFVDTNVVPNAFYRAVKIQDAPAGP